MNNQSHSRDRRRFLSGLAGAAAVGTAGCLDRLVAAVDRDAPSQLSIEIKTVPADRDEVAVRIARHLATNLETAGIDAVVSPMEESKLLRDVLVNGSFDMYVAQHPGRTDPDFLTEFLHSKFVEEAGWQNPLGYSNMAIDEKLDEQRAADPSERLQLIYELQETVLTEHPFTVIAFPDELRVLDNSIFDVEQGDSLQGTLDFLALEPTGERRRRDPTELRLGLTDGRVTRNRNPIAVEFRAEGTITSLLYDSLGRTVDGSLHPWMAESWEWLDEPTTAASVRLRPGLSWHDGEPITADDVAFTYRFLQDTTLDDERRPLPAPRFRGETALVETVETQDVRTIRFEFSDASRAVAERAFTVPILPEHVWRDRTESANIAGFDLEHTTEALVWENDEAIGSGPMQFESADPDRSVTLVKYEDHFLERVEDDALSEFAGKPAYDVLTLAVVPSSGAAIDLMEDDELDGTASALSPAVVPETIRNGRMELLVDRSERFYHVGYNVARGEPFSNFHFRRAVARMIDRNYLLDDVFSYFAAPAVTPMEGTEFLADSLVWDGECPELPFPGENGTLSPETAREVFRDANFQYNEDGELVH